VPTPSDFDHVIVWLPEWKIYADTTAGAVPFQMLPLVDTGKPVVHLVTSGPAQHRTPVVPSDLTTSSYKVSAVQARDGHFDVQVVTSATGPWAAGLRHLGDTIQALGPTAAAAAVLKMHNFSGPSGSLSAVTGSSAAGTFTIEGSFHAARPPIGGNMLSLTWGLQIVNRAGDGLIGPLNNTTITEADETPCYSGRQVEDIDFTFTNGEHLAKVPSDVHIQTENIAYDTHWTSTDNRLMLHREFLAKVSDPICSGRLRREAADVLAKIRSDYAQQALIAERAAAKSD